MNNDSDKDVKYRQKFWAIKTSGHNPWIQSQRCTRFANAVQYLVQACRPTRELTTEHELVRSVVPSTSVSWCVWHIDHARHLWNLTRVSQAASHISHTTRTRHLHRHTLSPYAQILCSTYIFNHNPVPNGWCSYETFSNQCDEWLQQLQCSQRSALSVKDAEGERNKLSNYSSEKKEKLWTWRHVMSGRHWLSKSYPITFFFEKVIRLQRAQEGDSGSIFCGFQTLRA